MASRRFGGDYSASDIIIDLHSAMNTACLTERQTEAIALVYGMDLTQKDAAAIMGVGQDSVSDFVNGAATRIAKVYSAWNYGEVITEDTEEEAV
ncbi:putative DNA-binding protein (UPF0251 family) [Paenibacillus sp. DS2015]|uniref:sigma factor-like helix-turn-helix DNA-binding protein n=1 Tax=Paenibacillus sp. DS2015 TaxID=3373917 RepID=UPI003D1C76B2